MSIRVYVTIAALAVVWSATVSIAAAQTSFVFTLRDGTRLTASLELSDLPWHRVASDGKVTQEKLSVAEISYLRFSQTSVSAQAKVIGQFLQHLSSPDYHTRNEAESELSSTGGPFLDLIVNAQNTASPEVRYRVHRILQKLQSKKTKQVSADYDEATLSRSAEAIRGDVGDWAPTIQYRGRTVQLNRDTLLSMEQVAGSEPAPSANATIDAIQTFRQPDDAFYLDGDAIVDFDSGRNDESFLTLEDISQSFEYQGVRLSALCEEPATVVTSGFRISQGRSGKNSAATMMSESGDRYHGMMRIDFCQKNAGSVPATVHKFGCFLAVVSNPREIVMTAYDRLGNVLARAEAFDKTSFVGVYSHLPIAYVTIASNLNLRMPVDQIDDDYALDDLVFDLPVFDDTRTMSGKHTVYLANGDRMTCDSVVIDADSIRLQQPSHLNEELAVELTAVQSIVFHREPVADRSPALWGVSTDGSIFPLEVSTEGQTLLANLTDRVIDRSELAAVFGNRHALQYAPSEDFANGRAVVVNPAERWLVESVTISADGLSWDGATAELREPVTLTGSVHAADGRAQFTLDDAPSIWFHPLNRIESELGIVETIDGQRYVLDGDFGFALAGITNAALTIRCDDATWEIPVAQVRLIKFPASLIP